MSRLCRLRTKTHGQDGQWAYEEITKLREQVSEIAAAKHMQREVDRVLVENHKLRETIAAQAAVIESFKSVALMCSGFDDHNWSEEESNKLIDALEFVQSEALAIPTDSTQILDEVRRAEREKCAKVCEEYEDRLETMRDADYQSDLAGRQAGAMRCANLIRAME